MDFYLTNISSGDRLRFPIVPDRLNVKTGANTLEFQIIKTGPVKIPRGSSLTGYSWNGTFPGERMSNYSFVFDWQQPARIVALLKEWEDKGYTLRFMVTELSINADVFIESFTYEYYGLGDCSYTLNLTMRRELTIQTVAAPVIPPQDPTTPDPDASKTWGTVKTSGSNLNVRQKPSTSSKILGKLKNGATVEILGKTGNWYIIPYTTGKDGKAYIYASYVKIKSTGTSGGGGSSGGGSGGSSGTGGGSGSSGGSGGGNYTVKSGDSLISIAKAQLGDSSRYIEIYNLNAAAINAANKGKTCSKYTIYAGMSLKLPAKSTTTKTSTSALAKKVVTAVKNTVTAVKTAISNVASAVKSTISKLTTKKPSGTVTSVKTVAQKVTTAVSNIAKGLSSLFKKK